jgi:hypothetical protein
MRLLPALILALAIVLAPVLWFALPRVFPGPGAGGPEGGAIDSGARIDIEMLSQQVEDLQIKVEELSNSLAEYAAGSQEAAPPSEGDDAEVFQQSGPNGIIDAYAKVVLIANRRNVNDGLVVATPSFLEQTFGPPRADLTDECQAMTNERLAPKLMDEEVGPIRVKMLKPAIESLRRVFENIRKTDADLYARINTAGSLCVRQIRGTVGRASTHSYGLAVDLNIDGVLDTLGDGKTQLGLTILADFFRTEGWVWGAAWSREDSMHFEVSRKQLDEWLASGAL